MTGCCSTDEGSTETALNIERGASIDVLGEPAYVRQATSSRVNFTTSNNSQFKQKMLFYSFLIQQNIWLSTETI